MSGDSSLDISPRELLEALPHGAVLADSTGQVLAHNETARALLSDAANGAGVRLKQALREVCSPSAGGKEGRESGLSELKALGLDDGRTVYIKSYPLKTNGSGSSPRKYLITLQERAECEPFVQELESFKALSRELEAIFNSSFDGIYITDNTGMTLKVNPAYERITGMKKESLVGRNVVDLVKEGMLPNCVTPLVVERKVPVTTTQTYRNGRTCYITGSPIFDEKGNVVRVVTNVRDISELQYLKEELEETRRRSIAFQSKLSEIQRKMAQLGGLVARSLEMQRVLDLAWTVSQVDSTVLIQGESGVGKELIARAIHAWSPRAKAPFIKINCGGIPETLLESELFGYESGAFTGARREGKIGLLELANGGTVLLDEISEMPQALQVKLLQVLQDSQFRRVGGTKLITVDVRVISATNKDLRTEIANGRFREDLFYRLNVVPIDVPPLRARQDDIPPLIYYYMKIFCEKYNLEKHISAEALHHMVYYDWPGNVRELRNVVERLVVMTPGKMINVSDLPEQIRRGGRSGGRKGAVVVSGIIPLKTAVEQVERELIAKALEKTRSTYKAAKLLGISQPTMFRKAKKYRLTEADMGAAGPGGTDASEVSGGV